MKPDELRAVLDKGTPGPWVNRPSGIVQRQGGDGPIVFWDDDGSNKVADYPLIALSVNLAPLHNELHEAVLEHWNAVRYEDGYYETIERVSAALTALAAFEVGKP